MSRRSYRKRKKSSSSTHDSDEEIPTKVSEIKEVQKFRNKRGGINAVSLAVGRIVTPEETLTGNVFIKSSASKPSDSQQDKYGLQVGSVFSAESNHREEDQLMNHYIKEELAKRRGVRTVSEVEDQYQQRINELFTVPEHLQTKNVSMTEDMMSDQVLTAARSDQGSDQGPKSPLTEELDKPHLIKKGIPEVDLGLSTKIENIEKTDQAINSISKMVDGPSRQDDDDDELPRNYTHDYARLDKINNTKTTLNILKDDRYV